MLVVYFVVLHKTYENLFTYMDHTAFWNIFVVEFEAGFFDKILDQFIFYAIINLFFLMIKWWKKGVQNMILIP